MPQLEDSQGQETFLAPSAGNQTCIYIYIKYICTDIDRYIDRYNCMHKYKYIYIYKKTNYC